MPKAIGNEFSASLPALTGCSSLSDSRTTSHRRTVLVVFCCVLVGMRQRQDCRFPKNGAPTIRRPIAGAWNLLERMGLGGLDVWNGENGACRRARHGEMQPAGSKDGG